MTLILLRSLLFTVIVPGTVAVYGPLLFLRDRSPSWGWEALPALACFLVAGGVYAWCVWDFASTGRGTPAPIAAPKRLVVRGPYRRTRNPMYLGVLAGILGWAFLFRSGVMLLYAAAAATAFHLFIVLYEEPHLRRAFGREYERYCRRVPRWLPRLRRSTGLY